MSRIWIGTSGWSYDGWRGPFYPQAVAKNRWLAWYGEVFPTTEINGSFYRTPSLHAVRSWREQTPNDFVFAWKASKRLPHFSSCSGSGGNTPSSSATRAGISTAPSNCCASQRVVVSVRSPRRARALRSHRRSHLHPRPRPDGRVQGPLQPEDPGRLGRQRLTSLISGQYGSEGASRATTAHQAKRVAAR